jgi:SAM-dependent methyltransferase
VLSCPVCDGDLEPHIAPWLRRCRECGFQTSTLAESIGDPRTADAIDESARRRALNALRERNFNTVLGILGALRPDRGTLLEIGCAHGWFLRAATRDGWVASGIEPDARIASLAVQSGSAVRAGMFPTALRPAEQFDVIAFNDVFEHLPDVSGAMRACAAALRPGGLLMINLPDARGAFYRMAWLFARLGYRAPLERLWQKDFPSPHLSYFTAPLLRRLAATHGFRVVRGGRLPSVAVRGLWSRLRYGRKASRPGSAMVWIATVAVAPILRFLPSDISYEVFERG